MDKDKTTHNNRAKGRIKGLRNHGQEEVILRKDSNINFYKIKGGDTNKDKEVFMKKFILSRTSRVF